MEEIQTQMNSYYIKTADQRHFIIQAPTCEAALNKIRKEIVHICPWTKKNIFKEPKLHPIRAACLNKPLDTTTLKKD